MEGEAKSKGKVVKKMSQEITLKWENVADDCEQGVLFWASSDECIAVPSGKL